MPPQDQLHHFPARIIGPEHIYPIRSPIISCSCFIGFNAVSSTTLILLPSVRLICRRPHQPQVPLTSKSWSSMASCKSTSQETSSSSTLARTLFTTSFPFTTQVKMTVPTVVLSVSAAIFLTAEHC